MNGYDDDALPLPIMKNKNIRIVLIAE